jgi:hypothetical protein
MTDFDALLNTRGTTQQFDAYVTAATFNRAGTHAAFALGDGTLRLTDTQSWSSAPAHDGAALSLAPDIDTQNFLPGGRDHAPAKIRHEMGRAHRQLVRAEIALPHRLRRRQTPSPSQCHR